MDLKLGLTILKLGGC